MVQKVYITFGLQSEHLLFRENKMNNCDISELLPDCLQFLWSQRNYPSVPSATTPSEDSIATLVSMGFDRNDARQALVQAQNDVNVATNILLEAQSHWLCKAFSLILGLKFRSRIPIINPILVVRQFYSIIRSNRYAFWKCRSTRRHHY